MIPARDAIKSLVMHKIETVLDAAARLKLLRLK